MRTSAARAYRDSLAEVPGAEELSQADLEEVLKQVLAAQTQES